MENVILTPHYGWYSEEAAAQLEDSVVQALAAVLKGQRPNHLLNTEV
jgi:D-3-phosphoglycerate dehydrogenase